MNANIAPLNGTKTHKLSQHAIDELRDISHRPVPSQSVNPGIANRLMRENLVEIVSLPSPFVSHKGKDISHLKITQAGVDRLLELDKSRKEW